MSNKDIAHDYAKKMAAVTNKVWISDNLPSLGRKDRREILDIYKQYFKVVEYDTITGVCKCWVNDPEPMSSFNTFGKFDSFNVATNKHSTAVKESTFASIGIRSDAAVDAGIIIINK
jgi:hypothetical protein